MWFGSLLPGLWASQGWRPQTETGWTGWCPGVGGCAVPVLSLLRGRMKTDGRGGVVLQRFERHFPVKKD